MPTYHSADIKRCGVCAKWFGDREYNHVEKSVKVQDSPAGCSKDPQGIHSPEQCACGQYRVTPEFEK